MKKEINNPIKIYHVSSPNNYVKIIQDGLKANEDGEIFLYKCSKALRLAIGTSIAMNQCFLEDYALFEINEKGIQNELINDNVAEFTAQYQFILNQSIIESKYLKFKGMYKIKNTIAF